MVTTERDKQVIDRTIEKLREAQIALPTFAQLADPAAFQLQFATRSARSGRTTRIH